MNTLQINGVEKKNWTLENNSDETVFPPTNTLEGWYIFHLKGLRLKYFCTMSGS